MELNDEKAVEGRLEDFDPAPLHQRLRLEALLKYCRSSGISTCIRFDKRICLAVILVHSGYYLGAAVGMALTFQPHAVSVLWPPNSILMGALLLARMRLWWVFILAAFPAHLAAELPRGVPLMMTSCWFLSNCSEALLGAAAIRLLLPSPIRFNSLESICVFFACGGFLAPFVSSFIDAGFVVWNGFGSEPYWGTWRMRFVSNAMTTLVTTPVVIWIGSLNWDLWRTTNCKRISEAICLAVGLGVVTVT